MAKLTRAELVRKLDAILDNKIAELEDLLRFAPHQHVDFQRLRVKAKAMLALLANIETLANTSERVDELIKCVDLFFSSANALVIEIKQLKASAARNGTD